MKKEFKNKLMELGVSAVYLFGSASTGRISPMSDIDIGVVFSNIKSAEYTNKIYISLYEIFAELYPAFTIDIVFLQSAPLALQYDAIKNGRVLFETDPKLRADYEANVMEMYLDFMPVLRVFDDMAAIRRAHV